jgi:hypothetical protein
MRGFPCLDNCLFGETLTADHHHSVRKLRGYDSFRQTSVVFRQG